jgi:hypothetical protein
VRSVVGAIAVTAAAIVVTLAAAAPEAYACDCRRLAPLSPAVREESAYIFAGRVLRIVERSERTVTTYDGGAESSARFLDKRAVFAVEKAWRGVEAPSFEVMVDASDCDPWFEPGKSYLVFADRDGDGRPYTSICLRTKRLAESAEVVALLGAPAYAP